MSSGVGIRRQLPPWMLRAAAADQASNSVSEAKSKENGLDISQSKQWKPEPSVVVEKAGVSACQSDSTKTEMCSLKKCKAARSKRQLKKRDEDDVSNIHEGDLEKENHSPLRRKRMVKVTKVKKGNAIKDSTVDEDELSVDDLISIAKECIDAEKGKGGERSSSGKCESERLPRSVSCEENSISNVNTLEGSSSNLVECEQSKKDAISSFKASDLAQDMLELLLGKHYM